MVTSAFSATKTYDAITAQYWIEIEGIPYRYGIDTYPIIIEANNNDWIDIRRAGQPADDEVQITAGSYATIDTLCSQIQAQLVASVHADTTCSHSGGTITIANATVNLTLKWKTGTHGSDNTDTHIGTLLCYKDTADTSSAATHASDWEYLSIRPWMVELPEITGQEAKPLDGDTEPLEFTVQILDVDNELSGLLALRQSANSTTVADTIASGDTTIKVTDCTVFSAGDDIYINRETMRVTATNAVPNPDEITVIRGMYGSTAVDHEIIYVSGEALDLYAYNKPQFIMTREIVLHENREGLAESNSIKLRGYINNYEETDGVYSFVCPSWLSRMDITIGTATPTGKLSMAIWGGGMKYESGYGDGWTVLQLNPPKGCNSAFSDYLIACFPDDDDTLYNEFPSSGAVMIDHEIIKYVSKIDTDVEPVLGLTKYYLCMNADIVFDTNARLWLSKTGNLKGRSYLSTAIGSPPKFYDSDMNLYDRGTSGGDTAERPALTIPYFLQGHLQGADVRLVLTPNNFDNNSSPCITGLNPIDITLQLWLSTGTNSAGTGGDNYSGSGTNYDSLPRSWGAGIPYSKVDISGLELLRDKYFKEDIYPHFAITDPTELKKWLQENIWRPNLLFPIETPDGKLSLARIFNRTEAAAMTGLVDINTDMLLAPPTITTGNPPMGRFTVKADYYPPTNNHYTTINVILGDGEENYQGLARDFEIECQTCYTYGRTGRTVQALSGTAAFRDLPSILQRYMSTIWEKYARFPTPVITCLVPYNRLADLYVGEVVTMTYTGLPNIRDGTRVFTAEYFQIIAATPKPAESALELKMFYIGTFDKPYRRIASSAKITAYADPGPGGKPRCTISANEFTLSTDDTYTADYQLFDAGDKIHIYDSEHVPLGGGAPELLTVHASAANYIDLTASPVNAPTGSNEYIEAAEYDSAISTQIAEWAYQAASTGLGAANSDSHRRKD